MKVGYVRVSSIDQNFDRQIDKLNEFGVEKIFKDEITGSSIKRPGLDNCRKFLRENDTLYVLSIDRLARDLINLQTLVQEFRDKNVTIHFIKENLIFGPDQASPMSSLLLQFLGAISQFERSLIKERQAEGIAAAKKRGKKFGRPNLLTPKQKDELNSRLAAGEKPSVLAKEFGVSRTTIWRIANENELAPAA